jgi:hypothetical protein
MAKVTLQEVATAFAGGVAGIATESGLTQANITAVTAFLQLLANRQGDSLPLMKLLSDTNKAQLYLNS